MTAWTATSPMSEAEVREARAQIAEARGLPEKAKEIREGVAYGTHGNYGRTGW